MEHPVPELADLCPAALRLSPVDAAQLPPRLPGVVSLAGAVCGGAAVGPVCLQHGPGEGAAHQGGHHAGG